MPPRQAGGQPLHPICALHAVTRAGRDTRVGFVHLPLLRSMVAEAGLELPSMDFPLVLRALETVLRVTAGA